MRAKQLISITSGTVSTRLNYVPAARFSFFYQLHARARPYVHAVNHRIPRPSLTSYELGLSENNAHTTQFI